MSLTIFFAGISAVSCTFEHKKNPPQNSPPHSGCIWRVTKVVLSTDTHWSGSWDTPAMDQTVYAKSCQQWKALSLDGLRLFLSMGNWQPLWGKHLQQIELQHYCSCRSLRRCWFKSRLHAGHSHSKVRRSQKSQKSLLHGAQLQANTNIFSDCSHITADADTTKQYFLMSFRG